MKIKKPIQKQRKYLFAFIDESGHLKSPKEDKVFALGILKARNINKLHKDIFNLKNKYKFKKEFHFANISVRSLKIYKSLVDIFFDSYHIYFAVKVFNKDDIDIKTYHKGNQYKAYNSFTAGIIVDSLEQGEYIAAIADDITTPKSDHFDKDIKRLIKNKTGRNALFGIIRLESHAIGEIQLTDVLLGTVSYAFKIKYGLISPSYNNPKYRLLLHLKNKLNIDKIAESNDCKLKRGARFVINEHKFKKK